ncbi:MAG: class IV adenylate cyclase [Candidatus Aenigmatarchaeota archaeon]
MEIEVKVRLEDLEEMKRKLAGRGAVFEEPVVQEDRYFKPKGFEKKVQVPGDFIVRIRKAWGKVILTSKILTEVRGAWIENETDITDPEEMEKILLLTGLVNAFNINKIRHIGKLGEFEICIDDVKELGKFMEVCLIADEHEQTRERIISFLKELGFSDKDIDTRGYGEIIGEKLGHKFGGMR